MGGGASTRPVTTGPATAQPKDAPSDEVTCAGCRKRIPRARIREHVEEEMKAMDRQHNAPKNKPAEE